MMTPQQVWQAALGELELIITRASFTTWFKNTYISSLENDRVIVCVPNNFTKTWLESKYNKVIIRALQNITQERIREIIYKVENTKGGVPGQVFPAQNVAQQDDFFRRPAIEEMARVSNSSGLNSKYIFTNFIVGKSNELAHAACKAVSEKLGTVYNPLFIYGGVGLGKTHLLQAIGHETLAKNNTEKKIKIFYASAETFTNDYIQAVKHGNAKDFKDRYRTLDLLLIDDIQFISGKEGTQEEFFHTFNALHHENKQIVMTSDRPPKDIDFLSSRLLSRFEWGMIADIGAPDFETRIAILEAKSREKNYQMDPEIIQRIAQSISNNIRELEGVLNRIIAYHQLNNTPPTKEHVENIIHTLTAIRPKTAITPKNLIIAVAEHFGLTFDDIFSKSREQKITHPRQIAMYLLREEIKFSFPAIGQELGGRDHTTAIHAHSKIQKDLNIDEKLKQDIEFLRQKLYQRVLK